MDNKYNKTRWESIPRTPKTQSGKDTLSPATPVWSKAGGAPIALKTNTPSKSKHENAGHRIQINMAEAKEKEGPNKREKVNRLKGCQIISHHFV